MKTTTAAAAVQAQAPAPANYNSERDMKELRAAISDMDCMAQEALGEIAAIAKLALLAMEAGQMEKPAGRELIAKALESIYRQSNHAEDAITAAAEDAGSPYVDTAHLRRMGVGR